jgi:DNA-binding Lrp family transcriptional regulator
MIDIDETDVKILKELIRDPRLSDNEISKRTKIPVMTVNRRRKALEKSGRLFYYAMWATGKHETHECKARQMYIIKFRLGLTKEQYLQTHGRHIKQEGFYSEHVVESFIGEKDGVLALVMIIEADTESELVECFNGKIVSRLQQRFGKDVISEIITTKITNVLRHHHNYLPFVNIENGKMKKDWPDEYLFVTREKFQ